ncbi:leukocyte receptor cluster member 9 [Thalassophryne amazonica]|uniref:leukocyte receptor cluster member 9 n=1 Tax=Thalassophryne amazonica TaxID=390379 RepID=UPI001472332A|nr:leukocyte receptor cluster member 9 [Thalassophryne amazonica]XP_034030529.1 leukocyte receptor cluster member 9 [Thalassophryne amazonica]
MASEESAAPSESPEDHNNDQDLLNPTADPAEQNEGVNTCQYFLMGKCHFGHRCHLSHRGPVLQDAGAALPDLDHGNDGIKAEKHKKKGKVSKATKSKDTEGKEVRKKPRMRTADDVISRILWDPTVDPSEFVVGYVDRFLGVLERPFSEFSWDTSPCDCNYSAELALPRHRIQYFIYRGQRIWDRHSRTDRVFGSTGQSLAPPFGGEEEIEEKNTDDEQQHEGLTSVQEGLDTAEDNPPAVGVLEESGTEARSSAENEHLEEEKQNDINVETPDSTQPTLNTQQESGGVHVMEEAENSLCTSMEQTSLSQKEEEEHDNATVGEWNESWEGNEETLCYLAALHVSRNPSACLEQREEKRGSRPPKRKPTHFITFRANTPAVLSSFQQLQEELTALLPSSAPHWKDAPSLHVTLCLLVLPGPVEVAAAGEILRRFARLDRNPPVAVTFPVKLKHFNGRVLYLSPQPQLHLQQLNSGLQEVYRTEGWLHRDSYNPRYHLTLAKVEDKEGERIFEGVGNLKVGKSLNFGRLPVNTLHLCAMGMSKTDGFYETLCTVTLR